jgi:hypothetical protein
MSVYVDPLMDHGWKLGRSCHLKPEWFQADQKARRPVPHYDLTAARRTHAVNLGALDVGRREAVSIWRRLCPLPSDARTRP